MYLLIIVILLPVLAVIGGWMQGDEVGPVMAAAPIPILVMLFAVPVGIYLMNSDDGTDMRHASGFLALIVGVIIAALSFGAGWTAGRLKERRMRGK